MKAAHSVGAEIDVWSDDFLSLANTAGLVLPAPRPEEVQVSEAHAARFALAVLRQSRSLRWRFPQALSDGEAGRFCRWLCRRGEAKFNLAERALTKIRGAFRRQPGKKVSEVYLNDPELQRLFPWGLLPFGQRHFLGWLTTHGRADQGLSDEQILWFLHASAENLSRGLALTYLLRPDLQKEFPLALCASDWPALARNVAEAHPRWRPSRSLYRRQQILTPLQERSLKERVLGDQSSSDAHVAGVNLLSHFCNPSGIQQAALWTKTAFERAGLETSCRDVPVPRKQRPISREQWLGLEVFPFTVLTHAAVPYFAPGYERSGLWRREGVYRIAYWAWELEAVPDEWVEVAPLVEEIWSPTEFVAEAMRARMPRPVYEMLPGVEVGPVDPVSRSEFNIPEDHCVFLFMFDLHSQLHRKNPAGVIRAFQQAFRRGDAVTLVIKVTGGDIHAADLAVLEQMCQSENIVLVDELMTRARAYGIVAMCDCFVSLHRSEGFGLGLAEAMLLGKPAIATGYSGNLAFMNRENSMLVDYEMVEITDERPIYTRGHVWAEPSVGHAAEHMRWVFENREEAAARAGRVRPAIEQRLSLEAAGQRMRRRLEEIAAADSPSLVHRVGIEPTTQ